MTDDDKPQLPGGATKIVPLGHCNEHGSELVAATTNDGRVTAITHAERVEDGESLPTDTDLYWTDDDGTVVDSMRLGSGPAQVATSTYRENYDAIFGKKKPNKELN